MVKHARGRTRKELEPTGIEAIDKLADLSDCSIDDYIRAVSSYVCEQSTLAVGRKKAAQIRLSNALGRAFVNDLRAKLPALQHAIVGERKVAGALRTTNADVSETHELDGLRLAVELKPVNLAVGRALWNRFGDLRTFAVNLHLKFPFAVIGGVLVVPTYEEVGTRAAAEAAASEVANETDQSPEPEQLPYPRPTTQDTEAPVAGQRSTRHLIRRAVQRLIRAGGRKTEADAAHLLEGIAVIAYDPNTSERDPRFARNRQRSTMGGVYPCHC